MNKSQPTTNLLSLQNGHSARIVAINGDRLMVRRMLSLGLRVGATINMLKHRGTSVLIRNEGTRIALGPSVVEKLQIELPEH